MARIDVPEWIPRVGMAGEAELPALGEQPVVSPYDRDEIARVAVSGEDAVDAAVAVALAAMGTAPIAAERARVLDRAAGIVEERAEVLADRAGGDLEHLSQFVDRRLALLLHREEDPALRRRQGRRQGRRKRGVH